MKVLASNPQLHSSGEPAGRLLLNCIRVVMGVCGARSAWAAARPGRASRPGALCKSGACPSPPEAVAIFFGDCVVPALPLEVERSKFNVESSPATTTPAAHLMTSNIQHGVHPQAHHVGLFSPLGALRELCAKLFILGISRQARQGSKAERKPRIARITRMIFDNGSSAYNSFLIRDIRAIRAIRGQNFPLFFCLSSQ